MKRKNVKRGKLVGRLEKRDAEEPMKKSADGLKKKGGSRRQKSRNASESKKNAVDVRKKKDAD